MHRIGDHILKEVISTPFMPTYPLLANPKYYFGLESMSFKRKRAGAEGILLSMPKHRNFFHWLIEFLPRLVLYDRCPHLKSVPLIMPKSSPGFIVESLKLTGYIPRTIFLDDGTYKFEKLYLLSMLSANDAISWLNEKFQTGQCSPVTPKRVYISRADAKIRFVSNESELQDTLLKFGFTTLVMSKLSLAEQISVFRAAECIIGPHGAAFTNLAFAQPGSTFIEFFSKGNIHTSYNRISGIRKLKYGFIVGEPTAMGGFSINPAQLRAVLAQALS
jgi:capsular polysaccharide biosynthesis protein